MPRVRWNSTPIIRHPTLSRTAEREQPLKIAKVDGVVQTNIVAVVRPREGLEPKGVGTRVPDEARAEKQKPLRAGLLSNPKIWKVAGSPTLLHRPLDRLVGVACGGRIHLANLRHLGHPVLVRILRVIGLDFKSLVERWR